jgi:hypothetical protein
MKSHRFSIICMALAAALGGGVRGDSGEDSAALAQRIKAAFVYNFIQFTEWPDGALGSPETPIVVGILDPDPLSGNLDKTILGKTAHGHPLTVRHFSDPAEAAGCHILYVSGDDASVRKALQAATGAMLTVGDSDAFADVGGGIRFYVAENKIRFEINLSSIEKSKLQMSSKLLKVAKTVRR